MYKKKPRTDFLFKERSFVTGLSSIFNIAGNGEEQINISNSGEEADCKAIKSDWDMVGQDFDKVLERIAKY